MRICTFTTLFPNQQMLNHGVFVKYRTLELAKMHEVVVVAPVPWSPQWLGVFSKKYQGFLKVPKEENIDGLKVYHPRYFVIPKVGRFLYGLMMYWSLRRFMGKLVVKHPFDLIDANFVYPDSFAAICLGQYLKKKVSVTARGSDINLYVNSLFTRYLIKWTLQKADAIISVSTSLKQKILELGVEVGSIQVIENGVDQNVFGYFDRKDARRELELDENKKILLSAGNLKYEKGFQYLIKAIRLLNREDVCLYIVGDGQYRDELNRVISDCGLEGRVKLVGSLEHKILAKWYAACDVFCLTSLREGRPNVVIEASACGAPVMSMQNWGLQEVIDQTKGILLDDYEISKVKNAIERSLAHQWDRETISKSWEGYTWEQTAKKCTELFEQTVIKEDVVFFSSDDWHSGLKTSKFHLSTRLANKDKVLFVNSLSLRAPNVSRRDFGKIINKLASFFKGLEVPRDNLYVMTPILIPFQKYPFIQKVNKWICLMQVRYYTRKLNMKNPIVWTFLPNSLEIVKSLDKKKLVYYCVDDMSSFKGVPRDEIKRMDRELTQLADRVFTVSRPLLEEKKNFSDKVYYSPHGVDFELFNQALTKKDIKKQEDIKNINSPIIGFYGLISSDWIDFELVKFLAQARPDWSFVFIGKIDQNSHDEIPRCENIHYLSIKPYESLYKYSRYFDVATLPFAVNELTSHAHPLKILEYLSSGCPVVSVDIPEVHEYKTVITIAKTYENFLKGIENNLKFDEGAQKKRVDFARNHSWEKRFDEVQSIISR